MLINADDEVKGGSFSNFILTLRRFDIFTGRLDAQIIYDQVTRNANVYYYVETEWEEWCPKTNMAIKMNKYRISK